MAPVALCRGKSRWGRWPAVLLLAATALLAAVDQPQARRRTNAQPPNRPAPAAPAAAAATAAPAAEGAPSSPAPVTPTAAQVEGPPIPPVPTDDDGRAAPPQAGTTTALRLPIAEPPGVAAPAPTVGQSGAEAPLTATPPAPAETRSAAPTLPPAPQDPTAAKAYAVLAANCASCHQRGAPAGAATGGSALGGIATEFGNILDLDHLARDPTLIQPGNPDGSRLYQTLYARHAPRDLMKGGREGPSVADVRAVRDWIDGLPAPAASSCPDRPRIDAAELNDTMRRWLEVAGADAARATRFVSLAHLHNACASDAELAAYRQAVQKLLNSLSWSDTPARIETVGETLVLLAFRLSDLGWVPAHWERLAKAEPEGGAVPTPEALKAVSGSAHPILRADWLASAAGRAPLYYELLGLPDKQADLARLVGIDLAQDVRTGKLARAGLKASRETGAPRLVERHGVERAGSDRQGAREMHELWIAHDWAQATPAQDVLDHPQAPHQASAASKAMPASEGSRYLLTLPNGLIAFGAHDAAGMRRPDAGGVPAGRACMGCHAAGPLPFTDEARAHIASDRFAGGREAREAGLLSYPGAADLARLFEDDGYRYRRALIRAGVDPDLTVNGLEIVGALSRAYERPVALERLAAEAGAKPAELTARLDALSGDARVLGQRIRQGLLSRRDAERLLAALKEAGPAVANGSGLHGTTAVATGSVGAVGAGSDIELALWSDRVSYAAGDHVTIHAQASRNCYLTLIDVDAGGKATVLFPNEFEPDNLIAAGATLSVPGPKSPYQLRLKDKGRETTVAICSTAVKVPAGIDIDYERQRFTALGLWTNHLEEAQVLEVELRRNPDRARAAAAARAHAAALALAKGRSAADDAAAAARAVPQPASPGPEAEARTAIQFKVE